MSKKRIDKSNYERCLLSEVAPYETPLIFSNWGSYNYHRKLKNLSLPPDLAKIMSGQKFTIPYNYEYSKDLLKKRTLSLLHPGASPKIIEFYKDFEIMIIKLCKKSQYSMRYPHSVARLYKYGKGSGEVEKEIEEFDENKAHASSYFSYMHFSHLHKFFESVAFTEIEKKFMYLRHLDISKCFSSIYTHSISWAIRGKLSAKNRMKIRNDKAIDAIFDYLMRFVNYKETNGIVIGPELSRIFAEIILQEIDKRIENKMKKQHYDHELDYHCCRYIDDYYLFYNDINIRECFIKIFVEELHEFKFYLNKEKIEDKIRPFISGISIKKIAISKYINELEQRISSEETKTFINSQKEINEIRSILNVNPQENHAITSFFLSKLTTSIHIINGLEKKKKVDTIRLFIDLAFYWVRIDTRVSSIFRITKFILDIMNSTESLKEYDQRSIKDKLYYEICETLKIAVLSRSSIEVMNLLITAEMLGEEYLIDSDLIDKIIEKNREDRSLDDRSIERLKYFEIVSVLYYVKSNSKYKKQKSQLFNDSIKILENYSVREYSESAHLLLDLVSCPHLSTYERKNLIKTAFSTMGSNRKKRKENINRFFNFVSKESWYTNWSAPDDLESILKKKQYMVAY